MTVVVLDVAVGGGWDAEWHRTRAFDGFFSPPHLLIYTLATVAMALVARLVLRPELRRAFDDGRRALVVAGVRVPGPLVLLGGGMAGIALAGPLDAIWHTSFGLDETPWSVPHAMLGSSLLVIALGAVSCRLALEPHRRMRWWTMPLLGLLVLFGTLTLLGPFGNPSPAAVRAASMQGQLAYDLAAQHTFRIFLRWNLTRTNPVYVGLGALWAGCAIGLLHTLLPRARAWVPVLFVFAVLIDAGAADNAARLGLADDPATRSGLPILWAALPILLAVRRWPVAAYAGCGAVFGLVAYAIWGRAEDPALGLLFLLLAPALGVAGGVVGSWTGRVVRSPYGPAPLLLVLGLVLAWPAMTGLLDLVLRTATP